MHEHTCTVNPVYSYHVWARGGGGIFRRFINGTWSSGLNGEEVLLQGGLNREVLLQGGLNREVLLQGGLNRGLITGWSE